MIIEIKAPSPGESISEVLLASWLAENGAYVDKDAEIAEIESDKATLMVYAPASGTLQHLVAAGENVEVGKAIATIDIAATAAQKKTSADPAKRKQEVVPAMRKQQDIKLTPLARSIADKTGVVKEQLASLHKSKITSKDVASIASPAGPGIPADQRSTRRVKMSPLRQKLSERLVSVKNETAMLTTFNEVNMSAVMEIRAKYGAQFKQKYGSGPGFISFFVKAVSAGLKEFPMINAAIDKDEIIYYDYADICIAVSTPKGLLAPAIRDAQDLSLGEIEQKIKDFAQRALQNSISLGELSGGTFTISNGGVFGSLLSTPIINPPQSAILGLHKMEDRPVAIAGKVVVQPMMYIALSYDHRLIDGKESVGFIVKIKELIENPVLLFGDNIGDLAGII